MRRRSWMTPEPLPLEVPDAPPDTRPPAIPGAVPVLGVDRDPGEVRLPSKGPLLSQPNPCVLAYGPGPEGKTCRSCSHLFARGGVAGRYLKCEERKVTAGPATDHRAGWPACSHYQEATP